MAEKRAKDRVILKLAGIHGLVYSEEEADDFKPQGRARPKQATVEQADDLTKQKLTRELGGLYKKLLSTGLVVEQVNEVWKQALAAAGAKGKDEITPDNIEALRDCVLEHIKTLDKAFKAK